MSSPQKEIQTITFINKNKETISGTLRHNQKTKPLLIICHGYESSMEDSSIKKISDLLYEYGHNTFTFNFSKSAQREALDNQVDDIKTVIEHFPGYNGYVLLGGSFGALSTAIAAIQLNKITGLVTVNGFFGTPDLNKEGLRIYRAFRLAALVSPYHKRIWHYMKKNLKPEDIKVPVLVVHSQTDTAVLIKQSQMFYEKLQGKKTFYTLKNADHLLRVEGNSTEVVEIIDEWLKNT